ncbi:MAG TPA: DUF4331 family protein [Pyrinomonadaceae bacterium]|jgi:hypothetical protein|nr:DUF4331 family protein [Pyrinomonadaceae bacterium]
MQGVLTNDGFAHNDLIAVDVSGAHPATVTLGGGDDITPDWQSLSVSTGPFANPIDDPRFFVQQQYLDFLNREPDQGGSDYWTSQMTKCGNDERSINEQRINVSSRRGNDQRNEGSFRQVSRLCNPLVNEVVIPLKLKDTFNASKPSDDAQFASFVVDLQLAKLLKAVFGINIPPAPRNDLVAISATGIPAGAVPGAPNYTTFLSDGKPHEMLRLNVAIPPNTINPSRLGLLNNDIAGYSNGRRLFDDVTDIALRAVAGGTPFTPSTNAVAEQRARRRRGE